MHITQHAWMLLRKFLCHCVFLTFGHWIRQKHIEWILYTGGYHAQQSNNNNKHSICFVVVQLNCIPVYGVHTRFLSKAQKTKKFISPFHMNRLWWPISFFEPLPIEFIHFKWNTSATALVSHINVHLFVIKERINIQSKHITYSITGACEIDPIQ